MCHFKELFVIAEILVFSISVSACAELEMSIPSPYLPAMCISISNADMIFSGNYLQPLL